MLQAREEAIYVGRRWFDFISGWGRGEKCVLLVLTCLPLLSLLVGAVLEWLRVSSLLALSEVQDVYLLPLSDPASVSA